MINCIYVGLGGFIGSILRYLISLIPLNENNSFPYKTLITNIIGAFIIGVIAALALKNKNINPRLVLFLKTGLCGGFTTFSTFALESYNLFSTGKIIASIIYIILSVTLCILMVLLADFIFS